MTRISKVLRALAVIGLCVATVTPTQARCSERPCIRTQGTEMSAKEVIAMTDSCDDFLKDGLGRRVLRMSLQQIADESRGRATPLARASFAFDRLYDSPLKFERKTRAEDTSYAQIEQACRQAERDFNDDSKWAR
jgi:hypothetical protein